MRHEVAGVGGVGAVPGVGAPTAFVRGEDESECDDEGPAVGRAVEQPGDRLPAPPVDGVVRLVDEVPEAEQIAGAVAAVGEGAGQCVVAVREGGWRRTRRWARCGARGGPAARRGGPFRRTATPRCWRRPCAGRPSPRRSPPRRWACGCSGLRARGGGGGRTRTRPRPCTRPRTAYRRRRAPGRQRGTPG
jgi:hypothetical protein